MEDTVTNVEKLRDHLTCRQPKRVSWKLCQHEGRLTLEQPRPRFLKHNFLFHFPLEGSQPLLRGWGLPSGDAKLALWGRAGERHLLLLFHIFFITNSPNSLWGIIHSIINLFFLGEGHLWWVQEKPARSWTSDRREEQEPRNSLHYSQAIKDTSWHCNLKSSVMGQ